MKNILTVCFALLFCFSIQIYTQIPTNVSVQIVKAEDERRFDKTLEDLMKNPSERIRIRAALAAGRIGDERAVPILVNLLENDSNETRVMAAFALGEIESVKAADAILKNLRVENITDAVRARLVEAAGKIAAANAKDAITVELGKAILDVLEAENKKTKADKTTVLLGLTAVLRARPAEGDNVAKKFLTNIDGRIRADAANTLARIRAKNANELLRAMLLADEYAIARANAARALGAAEDKDAFDVLLKSAIEDTDSRVRVSAIRSLGSLKDAKAADKLLEHGEKLLADYKKSKSAVPSEKNELLEIATTLGRILPNTNDERATKLLNELSDGVYNKASSLRKYHSVEVETALAKISPTAYISKFSVTEAMDKLGGDPIPLVVQLRFDWRAISNVSQGIAELAHLNENQNNKIKTYALSDLGTLLDNLSGSNLFLDHPEKSLARASTAIPDVLRAFAQFKIENLPQILSEYLNHKDIIIRATAAELLGGQPATKENVEALKTAFVKSLSTDKDSNDAQLAILSALVKLDKTNSVSSLNLALDAPDYLLRRHAANLIKQNDLSKDFPNAEKRVGTVKLYDAKTGTKLGQILNTNADYARAVSRRDAKAILTTEKGTFTMEFTPEDAPLTVDNFIKLAKSNYFNGLAIHRVVPNFVMQDGDPRGDGNGGPAWQIRCELNMQDYERGAVGMALSGKDTGGSQWFVTHSPQPHLDGGYTVFGRVNETGMKVVDNLARGDKILSVKIIEGNAPQKSTGSKR